MYRDHVPISIRTSSADLLDGDDTHGLHHFGDQLWGLPRAEIRITPGENQDSPFQVPQEVVLVAEARDRRYRFTELHSAEGLTVELLRQIPIPGLMSGFGWRALRTIDGNGRPVGLEIPEPATDGPTAEALVDVALIYRVAEIVGDKPTTQIAHVLGLKRPTAGRWAMRAREAGLLPPAS